MLIDEKEKFFAQVSLTFLACNKEIASAVLRLWWERLERFSFHDIKRALDDYLDDKKNGKFPPTIAHILEKIGGDKPKYHAIFPCCFRGNSCRSEGLYRVGDLKQEKFLCQEHYDQLRVRNDVDIEIDRRAKQHEEWAKQAEMTSHELCLEMNGIDPKKSDKGINDVKAALSHALKWKTKRVGDVIEQ